MSELLTEMLAEQNMERVIFSSRGSDAIETAFKITRQYWKLEGMRQMVKVFSIKNAFHGVHMGGHTAGGTKSGGKHMNPCSQDPSK